MGKIYNCKDDNGIYGIYIIDNINRTEELIYIGKTGVSFVERYKQHLNNVNNPKCDKKLYRRIRQAKRAGLDVKLRPLITLSDVKWTRKAVKDYDLSMMELSLISLFKPECNWEGVQSEYLFGYERID